MKVQDVMTRHPLTIDPEATLGTAIEVMRSRHVRHLPVVNDSGHLMGIITDRDLRQATFAPALAERLALRTQRWLRNLGGVLAELRVKDGMTWGVVTTHPETPLIHAAQLMFERRIGSLPVLDGGKLVGILTERDVLKALMKDESIEGFNPEDILW